MSLFSYKRQPPEARQTVDVAARVLAHVTEVLDLLAQHAAVLLLQQHEVHVFCIAGGGGFTCRRAIQSPSSSSRCVLPALAAAANNGVGVAAAAA